MFKLLNRFLSIFDIEDDETNIFNMIEHIGHEIVYVEIDEEELET